MRSMVVGLANSASFARLSTVRKFVKPSTASGSPPSYNIFCKQDFRLAYQLKTFNMELLMLQLLLEICGQGYVFHLLRHLLVSA